MTLASTITHVSVSSRSPAEVSFYLGLATAIATFSAAAVALGLLHCTRWRDRAQSVAVLLSGTLGIGAALATIARGRTSAIANVVIAIGVLVVAACVLMRALRLIYTQRKTARPPSYSAERSSSTCRLPVTWSPRYGDADVSGGPPSSNAPVYLGAAAGARVLRGPLWATASAFAAVVVLAALLALPELYSGILRSRPVGSASVIACSDGVDNDGDGSTDYPNDPGCSARNDPTEKETACADGRDNEGDGRTDYPKDRGCISRDDLSEKATACSDGRDNDADGKIDYPNDRGCFSPGERSERPECSDGRDNDGDGKIDYPRDPGCFSREGYRETEICADGRDNDGDGKIDYPNDPGCSAPNDHAEREPPCIDGRDNDSDGKIDYPQDSGCSSTRDGTEEK